MKFDTDFIRDQLALAEKASARKQIPNIPGYEADEDGNIWSVSSNWRGYGERKISPTLNRDGYLSVRVSVDGKRSNHPIHKLVCKAFHGENPGGKQVRHIDGNKLNNKPENLAWGSAKDNAADRDFHGTTAKGARNGSHTKPENRVRGEYCGASKLKNDDISEIRQLYESKECSQRELAKKFHVCRSTIELIVHRQTWTHLP